MDPQAFNAEIRVGVTEPIEPMLDNDSASVLLLCCEPSVRCVVTIYGFHAYRTYEAIDSRIC